MSKGEKTHAADAARLRSAPRCGARTRSGTACRSPAVHGRARCRMHGCGGGPARPSGAPRGNRNAWRHGYYAAAARARRRETLAFIRAMEAAVAGMEAMSRGPGGGDMFAPFSGARDSFAPFSGARDSFAPFSGARDSFAPFSGARGCSSFFGDRGTAPPSPPGDGRTIAFDSPG